MTSHMTHCHPLQSDSDRTNKLNAVTEAVAKAFPMFYSTNNIINEEFICNGTNDLQFFVLYEAVLLVNTDYKTRSELLAPLQTWVNGAPSILGLENRDLKVSSSTSACPVEIYTSGYPPCTIIGQPRRGGLGQGTSDSSSSKAAVITLSIFFGLAVIVIALLVAVVIVVLKYRKSQSTVKSSTVMTTKNVMSEGNSNPREEPRVPL